MSKKHSNISVFVPHIGCPNQCSFCNQFSITSCHTAPNEGDIEKAVSVAKSSKNYDPKTTELAFFGGSFTAIDREYMLRLLKAAHTFVQNGDISGIRVSTRPDAVDSEIIKILKSFGVTAVELGAQSMCDEVLKANRRGHTVRDIENASRLIKEAGFSLGLQMMTGLYKSSSQTDISAAEKIIALNPDTVRIYPTITLKGTHLETLFKSGEYCPPTLDDTVDLVAKLLLMFKKENINVIRTGLHSIEENPNVAGPWHPAFKELCDSAIYKWEILKHPKGNYTCFVPRGEISKAVGQGKQNINELKKHGYSLTFKECDDLSVYEIRMCKESAVKFNSDTRL